MTNYQVCTECNAKISIKLSTCPECNTVLSSDEYARPSSSVRSEQTAGNNKLMYRVILFIVLVSLLIIVIFIMNSE